MLFPLADQILNDEEQKLLMRAFESVESDHMGEGTRNRHRNIVGALAKKYGVQAGFAHAGSCGCKH